jgi:hypothetical protein
LKTRPIGHKPRQETSPCAAKLVSISKWRMSENGSGVQRLVFTDRLLTRAALLRIQYLHPRSLLERSGLPPLRQTRHRGRRPQVAPRVGEDFRPTPRSFSPGSVFPHRCRGGSSGHPSTNAVAGALQRPTRALGRAALKRALSGLAPGGVYLAFPVTREAGGLLHHRFTLTRAPPSTDKGCGRSVLCGTCLRVTPSGRYPPPCPVEPGRSSSHLRGARPSGCPILNQSTGAGRPFRRR